MNRRNATLLAMGIAFSTWASMFIYKTSFLVIGGERYFCLFDDAMISMRYAWNLSHGNGLVWNLGDHTEGFTNMLMTLIMAVPNAVLEKRFAVLAIQIFGAFTMLITAYFSMRIGLSIGGKPLCGPHRILYGSLSFAAPLLYYPLCYWTLMGMETGLLTGLLYAAIFLSISAKTSKTFHPALPIVLGCAFWTRPDAAIPVACILIFRAITIWKSDCPKKTLALDTLIVAGFVVSLTLFRWIYYGQIVPNTYTLKMSGIPLRLKLENGIGYITQYLAHMWFPLVLGMGGLILNRHRKTALIAALIVIAHGYQIYAGGDPWLYWRLLAPYAPLVFLLAISAIPNVVAVIGSSIKPNVRPKGTRIPRARFVEYAMSLLVVCLFFGLGNARFHHEAILMDLPYNVEFNHATVSAAKAIEEITTEDAVVGVFWAGSIPYYTGRKAVDFLGKTDKYIASLPPDTSGNVAWRGMKSVPGHNKYNLDHSIVELQPTYVQDGKWGSQNVTEFLRANYRGLYYKGIPLMLKKSSPSVNWDLVSKDIPASPHAKPLKRLHGIP